jgi:hypothetical protein
MYGSKLVAGDSRSAVRVRSSALYTPCASAKTPRQKGLDIPPSPKKANLSTISNPRATAKSGEVRFSALLTEDSVERLELSTACGSPASNPEY